MIKIFFILLITSIGSLLLAQSVTPADLNKIEGNWTGKLSYTDYKDDVSQSTLNCKLEAKWKNKKGKLSFIFVEPDGRIIKDKTTIKLRKNGTELLFDGKYRILDFSPDSNNDSWRLTIGTKGKDNNRNAEIKCVIEQSKTNLSIMKLVRYDGTSVFFERNRYAFEKEE